MTRLALILALALLAGCATPPEPVAWVDGPPADSADVLARLDRACESYEAEHGPLPRPVAVLVLWPRKVLPTDAQHGGWAEWSSSWQGVVVHVAYRGEGYAQVYQHELHHVRLGDALHADPSWRTLAVAQ